MVARTLSLKQQRFIEEFLLDGNVTAAAKRAGYSVKSARVTGQETLSNPAVRAALQTRQAAEAERLGITRQRVVAGLLESIELAKNNSDPATCVRGWAALGQLMGYYPSKHRVVEVTAPSLADTAAYQRMTDAELMKLICEKRRVKTYAAP